MYTMEKSMEATIGSAEFGSHIIREGLTGFTLNPTWSAIGA